MIDYLDIKDTVLTIDPIAGEITLEDFLNIIEDFLKDQELFESTIEKVLKKNPNNIPIANELLKLSSTSLIKFLIAYIKDEL